MDSAKRKRITILAIVAAIVVAGAAFALAFKYANSNNNQGVATAEVVVAASNIPAGTAITSNELGLLAVPVKLLPATPFQNPSQVIGQFAVIGIPTNTIISPTSVVANSSQLGTIGTAIVLQPGYVAISLPYAANYGAGGYLIAGDRIDIAVDVTGNGEVKYAFQDVPILRVGASPGVPGGTANLLVVSVPRGEAKVMLALLECEGDAKGGPVTPAIVCGSGSSGNGSTTTGAKPPGPHIVGYVLRAAADKGYQDSTAYLTPAQEQGVGPSLTQIFGP